MTDDLFPETLTESTIESNDKSKTKSTIKPSTEFLIDGLTFEENRLYRRKKYIEKSQNPKTNIKLYLDFYDKFN